MLGRCYKAELGKIVKGKGIYIALLLVFILIMFLGIFARVFDEGPLSMEQENILLKLIRETPRENYEAEIARIKGNLSQLENDNNTFWSRFVDDKGSIETFISVLEYLEKHPEINVNNIDIPSSGMFTLGKSSYNFLMTALMMLTEFAMFFGVILMSNLLSGEYREGMLKMELLRPNSRNTLFTAKWLAVMTASGVVLIFGTIVAALFAGFNFKFQSKLLLCVIANRHVFTLNSNVFIIIQLLLAFISIFAMVMFSAFMCTILRYNRTASLAIPIIVMLFNGLSAMLLQVIYLGMFDFVNNLNIISFIVPGGQTLMYVSLYSAVPILAMYIALFTSVAYIKFNRAEI